MYIFCCRRAVRKTDRLRAIIYYITKYVKRRGKAKAAKNHAARANPGCFFSFNLTSRNILKA